MRALDDLVRAGKIRYVGFSNTPAWVTAQAQTTRAAAGLDAADRAAGRVLAAGPHGRGRARAARARPGHGAGAVEPAEERVPVRQVPARQRRSPTPPARAFVGGPSEDEFDVIDAVAAIADELGTTSAAVALAWLRARPGTVVPILGARRVAHLEENLAGLDITSHPEHLRALDDVSARP